MKKFRNLVETKSCSCGCDGKCTCGSSCSCKPVVKEVAPPGREDQVKSLKKKFADKASAFKIAWWSYNHRKKK